MLLVFQVALGDCPRGAEWRPYLVRAVERPHLAQSMYCLPHYLKYPARVRVGTQNEAFVRRASLQMATAWCDDCHL